MKALIGKVELAIGKLSLDRFYFWNNFESKWG